MYKDAAGSSAVTLEPGPCVLRLTHTYGLRTGQVDEITFLPVAPPAELAGGAPVER